METAGEANLREPRMIPMLVASYRALPAWKKVLTVLSTLFIWPWMLFIATLALVSSVPIFLYGRWEGELGKRPVLRGAKNFVHHQRKLTHQYYAA